MPYGHVTDTDVDADGTTEDARQAWAGEEGTSAYMRITQRSSRPGSRGEEGAWPFRGGRDRTAPEGGEACIPGSDSDPAGATPAAEHSSSVPWRCPDGRS